MSFCAIISAFAGKSPRATLPSCIFSMDGGMGVKTKCVKIEDSIKRVKPM